MIQVSVYNDNGINMGKEEMLWGFDLACFGNLILQSPAVFKSSIQAQSKAQLLVARWVKSQLDPSAMQYGVPKDRKEWEKYAAT